MKNLFWTALGALLVSAGLSAMQLTRHEFNGLTYRFPSSQGVGALMNDGAGTLSWSTQTMPAGMVAFSVTGSCPTGWNPLTPLQGRYILTSPTGAVGHAVGTALAEGENRETPVHTHNASLNATIQDNGHTHAVIDPGHTHGGAAASGGDNAASEVPGMFGGTQSGTSTTGIDNNVASPNISLASSIAVGYTGRTLGTVAPYIQLLMCYKT